MKRLRHKALAWAALRRPRTALPRPPARQHLCVVLHEVSPHNQDACERVLRHLRMVAADAGVALPVTLLVVPMQGETRSSYRYTQWLERQIFVGHELALQGLTQRQERAAPHGGQQHLHRRGPDAGAGDIASLSRAEAASRLAHAQVWAACHALHLRGFVAPGWRLDPGCLEVVIDSGFSYTCTPDQVLALPERQALPARSLVFSSRSALSRALSVAWNSLLAWRMRQTQAPLLRIELHPADYEPEAVRACWTRLLSQALRERQPLHLSQAAALARGVQTRRLSGTPPARACA